MPLILSFIAETTIPVEVDGLTPDVVAGWPINRIRRFKIRHGNRTVQLADLFDVSGDSSDGRLELFGPTAGVHWIGAHMRNGEIHVRGDAGRHAGSGMRGGTIVIEASAGDWLGGEMRGGTIHVEGDAGDDVGAAYPGNRRGMTGGTILIAGGAGGEIGRAMRRGLIAVGGDAGEMAGHRMLAGTILLFGTVGRYLGVAMRRGSIAALGEAPAIAPAFRRECRYRPPMLAPIFRELISQGFRCDAALAREEYELYSGDHLALGKGELLVRAGATPRTE